MKKDAERRWMRRLVRRCRAACRTHDTQVSACILLSGPQVIAAIMSDAPWWVCVLVALIWPAVAFLSNLANPIPPNYEIVEENVLKPVKVLRAKV